MKPIHIRFEHWYPKRILLPLFGLTAITLGRTLYFARSKQNVSITLIKHEVIHVHQMERLGLIRFGLRYFGEYTWNFLRMWDRNRAYLAISFEAEAYGKQNRVMGQDEADALREGGYEF